MSHFIPFGAAASSSGAASVPHFGCARHKDVMQDCLKCMRVFRQRELTSLTAKTNARTLSSVFSDLKRYLAKKKEVTEAYRVADEIVTARRAAEAAAMAGAAAAAADSESSEVVIPVVGRERQCDRCGSHDDIVRGGENDDFVNMRKRCLDETASNNEEPLDNEGNNDESEPEEIIDVVVYENQMPPRGMLRPHVETAYINLETNPSTWLERAANHEWPLQGEGEPMAMHCMIYAPGGVAS